MKHVMVLEGCHERLGRVGCSPWEPLPVWICDDHLSAFGRDESTGTTQQDEGWITAHRVRVRQRVGDTTVTKPINVVRIVRVIVITVGKSMRCKTDV